MKVLYICILNVYLCIFFGFYIRSVVWNGSFLYLNVENLK